MAAHGPPETHAPHRRDRCAASAGGEPAGSAAASGQSPGRHLTRLSLQRPRPLGPTAPRGQDARDLLFYDAAINHPEFGVTPASILAAFRTAEVGDPTQQNDLFDGLIEGDCHLRSLFEKREQAVAGKPRVIQAGDDTVDGQLGAEVMRVAMSRLPLVEVFEHLLKYNRHGYSGCEIDWASSGWVGATGSFRRGSRRSRSGGSASTRARWASRTAAGSTSSA